MSMRLPEASPASFARRAIVPARRRVAALVTPLDEIEQVTAEVRAALEGLPVRTAEAALDPALRARSAVSAQGNGPEAVLIANTSEDQGLWRAVECHRSRLEDGATTLFVLSEGAAATLQRTAPSLMSVLGTMWAAEPRVERRLAEAIDAARAGRYPELYEEADAREARDLDEATNHVLDALGDPRVDDRAWRRLGYMGRAALAEVVPTIAAHWPPGLASADTVGEALAAWLSSASGPAAVEGVSAAPLAPQALAEALGVVESAVHLLDRAQARAAVSEILDSIFQGYAVFPGSEGRRALFDWWLDDVVPAAAALRAPPPFALTRRVFRACDRSEHEAAHGYRRRVQGPVRARAAARSGSHTAEDRSGLPLHRAATLRELRERDRSIRGALSAGDRRRGVRPPLSVARKARLGRRWLSP